MRDASPLPTVSGETGTSATATDAVYPVGYSQQQKTKMFTITTWQHSTALEYITLPLWKRGTEMAWQSGSIETVPVRRRDQLRVLAFWMTAPEHLSWGRFANWTKGAGNPAA